MSAPSVQFGAELVFAFNVMERSVRCELIVTHLRMKGMSGAIRGAMSGAISGAIRSLDSSRTERSTVPLSALTFCASC